MERNASGDFGAIRRQRAKGLRPAQEIMAGRLLKQLEGVHSVGAGNDGNLRPARLRGTAARSHVHRLYRHDRMAIVGRPASTNSLQALRAN